MQPSNMTSNASGVSVSTANVMGNNISEKTWTVTKRIEVRREEDVMTPAGSYKAMKTIATTVTSTASGAKKQFINTYWYGKDIGLIKRIFTNSQGETTTTLLKSYTNSCL